MSATYNQEILLAEHVSTAAKTRPFLKWAGGKSNLLPVLRTHRPQKYNNYFEPFLGSGAHFFDLSPEQAILSDANEELINCFCIVRDAPKELAEELRGFKKDREAYYEARAWDPEILHNIKRAARMIYLNKTCYNGLYRVNKKGLFNTPYGSNERVRLPQTEDLIGASKALKGKKIIMSDYYEILEKNAGRGDFIYLDPPYLPISKYSDFKRYTTEFFYEEDHKKLAALFRELDERGCFLILSNSFHEDILHLYRGFSINTTTAARSINCRGERRGHITELIITNRRSNNW